MKSVSREEQIQRLLEPQPAPIRFKRQNPTAYLYQPYSRKMFRRLHLFTPDSYDLWAIMEWDYDIESFNERVAKVVLSVQDGNTVEFTPRLVTVSLEQAVAIHLIDGEVDPDTGRRNIFGEAGIASLHEWGSHYGIAVRIWTHESIHKNEILLGNIKLLLRYVTRRNLDVSLQLMETLRQALKRHRKCTIAYLLDSLPKDVTGDVADESIYGLALMIQRGDIYSDMADYAFGPSSELSFFHDLNHAEP